MLSRPPSRVLSRVLSRPPSRVLSRVRAPLGRGCEGSQRESALRLCLPAEKGLESYLGTPPGSAPRDLSAREEIGRRRSRKRALTMGYGVIGNTTVSGTVILGSSPGTPALIDHRIDRPAPRSSSGPGRRPLTAVTPVQIRYGVRHESEGFVIAPFV